MATSADLSWEENLAAHWMSNASRAGVILNPSLPSLRATRAVNVGNASLSFAVNSLRSSSCASLSEDSLHGEDASESCSPCEGQLGAAKTPFPFTMGKKQPVLMVKEGPGPCKALQNDSECSREDDMHEGCCNEPLSQKLEQLKGLQQLKQEELKRQQMEQIQRLREEQQKLLSLVSEQHAHIGVAVKDDDTGRQCSQSARLSPAPYFLPCRAGNSVPRDSTSCVSPAGQKDPLQILSDDQISKGISSGDPSCKNQLLEIQNESEAADQTSISGGSSRSPEPNLGGSVDGCSNSESPGNLETGQKCLEILSAEERPIPTSIQERKRTFQELLEEQIRMEEQRLIQKGNRKDVGRSASLREVPKQPFLKRGEGLSRFTGAKSKVAKQKESKVTVHPDPSEVSNTVKADKPQLHRKIAPLNKEHVSENSVPKRGNSFAKPRKGSALPAQKTATQRNNTGKGTPLSTRQNCSDKKVGPLRESAESEKNKENIVELAKANEAGSKSFGETHQSPSESTQALSHPKGLADCSEKDSELSFELSFQKKLENWDADNEKEKIELDEFLFLEQAADEISFASNSSLILKILDRGQQISTGHRMSSTPIKLAQPQQRLEALDVADVHQREDLPSQQASKERNRGPAAESQAPVILKDHLNKADTEMLWAFPTARFQDFRNTGWDEGSSDGNSETTSDSEEEFETTIKLAREEPKGLNNQGDSPAYSGCRGQDKGVSRGANLNLLEDNFTSSQSSEIIADDAPEPQSICSANRNKVEFDDERSWSDFEEHGRLRIQVPSTDVGIKAPPPTDCSAWSESFFPDKAIKRKIVTMKKGDALAKPSVADSEVTAPPTTDLMLKLFPSLRLKPKGDVQQRPETKPNMGQGEPADTARSQLLREKLVELETEIERFRMENASLTKLREELEGSLENLRKEIASFEQQKAKELAQIEEMKKEETRKLQKERKVFEKYALAARAIPDKKERDEIQALKQQAATLQEDLKRREAKWSTTHLRLRDQIEALTRENTELREEIKIMERFRLEAWKREKDAANNRKADSCGVYSKRAAEIEVVAIFPSGSHQENKHAPVILQKSQNVSSLPQAEKSNKTNGKGDLPPEGRHSSRSTLAAVPNESYLDNPAMTHEDSSKTFMVTSKNFPGNGTVETPTPATPVYIDSEEETQSEVSHPDGKIEKILKDGSHHIFFPNGTRKEVSCDGKTTTVTFFNGDIKQVLEDQRVIYYYADAKTTHTTYPTGLEVLHFSNGQIEKYFPDGRKEIVFPDQIVKNIFPDGQEENIFPDGTIIHIQQDGSKTIEFSNGQEELHTAHFRRRKYPDGSTKTIYANGCQETKYASGRVRVKDKDGKVIMDTFPETTTTSH